MTGSKFYWSLEPRGTEATEQVGSGPSGDAPKTQFLPVEEDSFDIKNNEGLQQNISNQPVHYRAEIPAGSARIGAGLSQKIFFEEERRGKDH
jgi:hypothetical protein